MLSSKCLELDFDKITNNLLHFIKKQIQKSGLNGAVVAVSGGIDSSVILVLTVRAIGAENIVAITMPEHDVTPEGDITDVMRLTKQLDVTCDVVEITPVLHVMSKILPLYEYSDRVSKGNIKARIRMTIAYHYANSYQKMFIGSTNKTEWLTGYFTKFGDGAVDLMPIADLYKTQVRQLAKFLEIPEKIIKKLPSAGFWPGQSDEGELGVTYDILDLILYGNEKGMRKKEIMVDLKVEESLVDRVLDRVKSNAHKRRLPLFLRLSSTNG